MSRARSIPHLLIQSLTLSIQLPKLEIYKFISLTEHIERLRGYGNNQPPLFERDKLWSRRRVTEFLNRAQFPSLKRLS
jgi:hypothetical protein